MSNPQDSEEDILFGGEATSPVSVPTGSSAAADDWEPLADEPGDPLSAPPVEAAPAATAEPIMDPGVAVPPEPPSAEPDRPKPVARIPVRPSAISPARVTGPRTRPRRVSVLAPLAVAAAGLAAGAVMMLQFDNPPLAVVAVSLGVIGALFTRVLLRESR